MAAVAVGRHQSSSVRNSAPDDSANVAVRHRTASSPRHHLATASPLFFPETVGEFSTLTSASCTPAFMATAAVPHLEAPRLH
jgi:hypothetical protein